MSRRVFVLAPHNHDISKAERYGEIVFLYDRLGGTSIWANKFVDDAMELMAQLAFDEYKDYVLVSGAMAPVTLWLANVVARYENVNLLLYDPPNEEYVHKTVS